MIIVATLVSRSFVKAGHKLSIVGVVSSRPPCTHAHSFAPAFLGSTGCPPLTYIKTQTRQLRVAAAFSSPSPPATPCKAKHNNVTTPSYAYSCVMRQVPAGFNHFAPPAIVNDFGIPFSSIMVSHWPTDGGAPSPLTHPTADHLLLAHMPSCPPRRCASRALLLDLAV